MPNDGSGLRLEREVSILQTITERKLRLDSRFPMGNSRDRWRLTRNWITDCFQSLKEVRNRRVVKRLRRVLWRLVELVQPLLPPLPEPVVAAAARPAARGVDTRVVSRSEEAGIFALLMAAPRGEGQLLN